jgi:Glutamate-1-semialdehyde aminotransferase
LATLKATRVPGFYDSLTARTLSLVEGLAKAAGEAGEIFSAASVGGMFGVYFSALPPRTYAEVMACDKDRFNRFFHAMIHEGVYLAPSAFEAGFVSAAHTDAEINATIEAAKRAFAKI